MVLLSRYPILEQGVLDQPADLWPRPDVMWARLALEGGATLRVVTAHPRPARWGREPCLSRVCYDPSRRDAQLASIRAFVAPALARGERLLLLGDFNVTDREPAYRDLAAGLQDAYMAVGSGAANTWGPGNLMSHGLALLRIDYFFTSPALRPLRLAVDCTPRGSDHCLLLGTFTSNER
jgi:endonuclease/exonuclease/phosphatase family metal-dependent hydrolase